MLSVKTKIKKPKTKFHSIINREITSKKIKTIFSILPYDSTANKITFYKAFNINNINTINLRDYIKKQGIKIYELNPNLIFTTYKDIKIDYSRYNAQREKFSTYSNDYDLVSCDIIGKNLETNLYEIIGDDVDMRDNLYVNSDGRIFYYISNTTELFDTLNKLYEQKKPKFKIEILDDKLEIPYFSQQSSSLESSNGGNKKTYVKYGKYVRKVCIDKSKKYIKVNKEIIYLNDIKGKYKYVNK